MRKFHILLLFFVALASLSLKDCRTLLMMQREFQKGFAKATIIFFHLERE